MQTCVDANGYLIEEEQNIGIFVRRGNSANPLGIVAALWRYRELIATAARREVLGRYRGSVMGILWSFLNPLFMLMVYTFVFSEVFKARWAGGSESKTEFALVLFAGLIVFNIFAECVNRAPALILSNVNYVKKVVFPLEVLPFINLAASVFHAAVSLLVWFVAYVVFFGVPHAAALLLPVILLPFLVLILGVSWVLASLGVFLRDVSQFIGVITTAMMFLSPIFYPAAAIPEPYRQWLHLNPLTLIVEQVRGTLVWGVVPDFGLLALYFLAAVLIASAGFAWFQMTRKGFADVL